MRPSAMSFSRAMRATSRRTGSKLERVMASGVSSMIKSTPVRVSMARMFRPSRPMMRPFISSLGRGTTLMAASLTWSAAQRWMARAMISRADLSASSLVCCSNSRIFTAFSWVSSLSRLFSRYSLAWSTVKLEIFSSMSNWLFFTASASFRRSSAFLFFWSIWFSLRSMDSSFFSRLSSFWRTRRS